MSPEFYAQFRELIVLGFTTFVAALIGGASGSGIILIIEYRRRLYEELAVFNSTVAILLVHLNDLLTTRRQIIVPAVDSFKNLLTQFELADAARKANKPLPKIIFSPGDSIKETHAYSRDFLISIEKLANAAKGKSKALICVVRAKEAIAGFDAMVIRRNVLIQELQASNLSIPDRMLMMAGKEYAPGQVNEHFKNVTEGLLSENDAALFFTYKAMLHVQKLAQEQLPKCLQSKIATFEIDEAEKALIPGDEFLPNFP